jgi:hypothetical protein
MYFYLFIKNVHLILENFGESFTDPFQKSLAKVVSLAWIIK